MPASVRVVHLAWGPLGPAALERYLRAHRAHDPGLDHELLVVLNGFTPEAQAAARAALDGVTAFATPRPVQDLEAYRRAVAAHPAGAYCFMNSYARPLEEQWLRKLVDAARQHGIAAATGSYESQRVPFPPATTDRRALLTHAGPAVRSRLAFRPFPNPHVRTNAFALTHETLSRVSWPATTSKREALTLESGRRSLTAQAGDPVLVARDGGTVAPADWPDARIFRSGGQERLLVADNRTQQYAEATPEDRAELRRLAWGTRSP